MAATKYPNNLEIQINEPIDTRLVCDKLEDLTEYLYEGLLVYCKDDEKYYSVKSIDNAGNAEWEELSFDSTYNTTLEGTLATENAIGGIPQGTTVASLTAKTLTQIFDDLLFPTKNPTHTNPSVGNFNLSSTVRTVKIGSNVLTFANEVTLNKGVWSQYNNNMAYTGDKTGVTYTAIVNGTTYTGTTYNGLTLPTTYTIPGNHTYKAKISYSAGSAPKNNKGVVQPSLAAPAGSITTNDTVVKVTYPIFATTINAGELTEQSTLKAWSTASGGMDFLDIYLAPQGPDLELTERQGFRIPLRTVHTVYEYNSLDSQNPWQNVTSSWIIPEGQEDGTDVTINGITVKYYTYYLNQTANNNGKRIRIKF